MTERGYDAVIIPHHVLKEQDVERRLKALEESVSTLTDQLNEALEDLEDCRSALGAGQ